MLHKASTNEYRILKGCTTVGLKAKFSLCHWKCKESGKLLT